MIEAFGLAKTKELLFLCESFSVEEAKQYNLVNTIVPSEKLDETVTQYIDKLSRISPAMLTLYKELLNHALDSRFDEVLSLEFVDAAINKHNK
jgi:enoyl-CoA hydratase/carnithine racemase